MAHRLVTLFRKAKAHRGQDFATRVVQAFYRNRYATKSPTVDKYVFDESKHPRGQPENAGEFAEVHATIGDKPGEGVHLKLPHGSSIQAPWQERQNEGTQTLPSSNIEPIGSDVKLMEGEPPRDPNVETPPDPETVARTPEELGSIESVLLTDTVWSKQPAPETSANTVYFIAMESGKRAVFKPKNGEFQNGRMDIPNGTLGTREVAFYDAAKVAGVADLVPVTVTKKLYPMSDEGQKGRSEEEGSCQEFCEDAQLARKMEWPESHDGPKDAARAIVFDFIMGNTDRHGKNWMIDKTGKIRLIDNGYCLPEAHGLQTLAFMGARQNELALQWNHLPLDEAKAAISDKMPAIADALKDRGISDAAIERMNERYEIIAQTKDWSAAIEELYRRAAAA